MTWTVSQSGTTSALTVGTETTLGSADTNNATFSGFVDTSNMAAGDVLEIRVKAGNLTTTLLQVWKGTYASVQTDPLKELPFIPSDQAYSVTLKQTAGTGRTYGWKFLRQ
jgi:hypothetical protein